MYAVIYIYIYIYIFIYIYIYIYIYIFIYIYIYIYIYNLYCVKQRWPISNANNYLDYLFVMTLYV